MTEIIGWVSSFVLLLTLAATLSVAATFETKEFDVSVDILSDGSLDYEDAVLAELDWVVASPHFALSQDTEKATALWEADVQIPNIACRACVLQVIEFMAEHGRNRDGDFSYHHCAAVNITPDGFHGEWNYCIRSARRKM